MIINTWIFFLPLSMWSWMPSCPSAIYTYPHSPPSPLLIVGTSGGWAIVLSRPAFSLSPSHIDCSSLGWISCGENIKSLCFPPCIAVGTHRLQGKPSRKVEAWWWGYLSDSGILGCDLCGRACVRICVHTRSHACLSVYAFVCPLCLCVFVCMCLSVSVCVCLCLSVSVCFSPSVHAHMPTWMFMVLGSWGLKSGSRTC